MVCKCSKRASTPAPNPVAPYGVRGKRDKIRCVAFDTSQAPRDAAAPEENSCHIGRREFRAAIRAVMIVLRLKIERVGSKFVLRWIQTAALTCAGCTARSMT